ncbi:dihydrodipicolinate synthase family protein [uncultured Desulfosarcina sp.]|uniref:dihydrodipicolinate synthase family protein n=1 Tax=uncultured Desulfosarcina sp. TaxID=218289 RepID=UPI0029C8629D|nr:dihydrodipicolinate synthase family protein [uncultured Desulfosarcina sp.]
MIKTRPISGIVPVISTPFTNDENIDIDGLNNLINYLLKKEIGGMWVLGTGSEDMNLTFQKRLKVANAACEANAGQKPLILGTGFFAMEDIMNFIKETSHLDFDGYHVMPYHPLLSLERLEWFYIKIADSCPKPLWMYTSGNWSRPITVDFVRRLKSHPNIAGIKYSNKDAVNVTKVASLADEQFQVITAVASQLYACLCMGSKAHTSSLGSAIPDQLIYVYNLFKAGNLKEALGAQHVLNDILRDISTGAKVDNFLTAAEEKYILSLKGICEEHTSSYYRELNESEKMKVKKAVEKYNLLS